MGGLGGLGGRIHIIMYSTNVKHNERMCSKHMAFITKAFILFTIAFTLIDAQEEQIGDTGLGELIDLKRSAFLPSRGRRFWSMFDWNDSTSGEKRMSRFLPMRGRKAGFLPMRGKKMSANPLNDEWTHTHPLYDNTDNTGTYDMMASIPLKRAAFMPSRGKKAFHAMRGKKWSPEMVSDVIYSSL
ncbi:unnamed protein product [Oppiella nova]|uniref:Uncharacterized protein n=1 Tax=Oppiella nova TaxID=334625 RepID=A0A7R9LPG9_9ACAR|nr:unnamed protein product [Oppiella nova]CAG2165687.1 unnamed protein product [Oppiella nova]